MTAALAGLCALTWLGLAPAIRVCDPQLAVDLAWLPTPGAELMHQQRAVWSDPPQLGLPQGHDPVDPWGRQWITSGFYFGGSSGAGWGVSVTGSLGPDGVDQDGEGDDLIVSCDRAGAKAAAAGRRPAGPPYTPPLAHWLLALGDQACGALALILAWLLLVERQLVRWGPVSVWHLCWIAPGPAVLVAWFAAHAWADLELQPALPTLVPGWVAAGATVGLLVAIACGAWLWALQPADATRAAPAREAA